MEGEEGLQFCMRGGGGIGWQLLASLGGWGDGGYNYCCEEMRYIGWVGLGLGLIRNG